MQSKKKCALKGENAKTSKADHLSHSLSFALCSERTSLHCQECCPSPRPGRQLAHVQEHGSLPPQEDTCQLPRKRHAFPQLQEVDFWQHLAEHICCLAHQEQEPLSPPPQRHGLYSAGLDTQSQLADSRSLVVMDQVAGRRHRSEIGRDPFGHGETTEAYSEDWSFKD